MLYERCCRSKQGKAAIKFRCAVWLARVSTHDIIETRAIFQAHVEKPRFGAHGAWVCTCRTASVAGLVEDQAELLEAYRPRPTLAMSHGQKVSRRALGELDRNAFQLDNTQADESDLDLDAFTGRSVW